MPTAPLCSLFLSAYCSSVPIVPLCPLFLCAYCSSVPTVPLCLLFLCAYCSSVPTVPLCPLFLCAYCSSVLIDNVMLLRYYVTGASYTVHKPRIESRISSFARNQDFSIFITRKDFEKTIYFSRKEQ